MSNDKRLDLLTMDEKKFEAAKFPADQDKELSIIDKAKGNDILRLFIGFVRNNNSGLVKCSVQDYAEFLDWLSSENIDVYKEDWDKFETIRLELSRHLSHKRRQKNPLFWALSLKEMLPILLKSNGDIKYVDENGKTILHLFLESHVRKSDFSLDCITAKTLSMVKYLMFRGISVEFADANGNTPLHHAAKLTNTKLMEMMLQNCVNMNACNEQGDSTLHLVADNCVEYDGAPIRKIAKLAELMLSKGADVNLQNKKGWTPLHFAAKRNHLYMIRLFVKNGANLKLLTNDGENALLLSCKHIGSMEDACIPEVSAELLIKGGCDVNVTDPNGSSPLHYVSLHYHSRTAKLLIEASANVHCKTKDFGLTPLHNAVDHGDLKIATLLVDAGADVNANCKAVDNVTPICLAALRSSGLDVIEYLIKKGANIRCCEKLFGFTLVHLVTLSLCQDTKGCLSLLNHGLDVNDGGKYGITALHLASILGKVELVKMLIERGADVRCQDNVTHSTPLHFAAREVQVLDFVSFISGVKRKPFWKIIEPSMKQDNEGVITVLVENGGDINVKDTFGRTALHVSTLYEAPEVIKNDILAMCFARMREEINSTRGLLKYGAHMDVQDNEGNLPLHNALNTGHEKALKSLLDFNVDVDETDTSSIVLVCRENLKNQILSHLVKLRAAGLPVSSVYATHIDKFEFEFHYDQCLSEAEKMKTHLIDSGTSLYDLIHMNWKRRLHFVDKVPRDLQVKYPRYSGIIQSSCREALQRKLLFEPAKLALRQLIKVNLPEICVEHILSYLKNRYLRVLIDGAFIDSM